MFPTRAVCEACTNSKVVNYQNLPSIPRASCSRLPVSCRAIPPDVSVVSPGQGWGLKGLCFGRWKGGISHETALGSWDSDRGSDALVWVQLCRVLAASSLASGFTSPDLRFCICEVGTSHLSEVAFIRHRPEKAQPGA